MNLAAHYSVKRAGAAGEHDCGGGVACAIFCGGPAAMDAAAFAKYSGGRSRLMVFDGAKDAAPLVNTTEETAGPLTPVGEQRDRVHGRPRAAADDCAGDGGERTDHAPDPVRSWHGQLAGGDAGRQTTVLLGQRRGLADPARWGEPERSARRQRDDAGPRRGKSFRAGDRVSQDAPGASSAAWRPGTARFRCRSHSVFRPT